MVNIYKSILVYQNPLPPSKFHHHSTDKYVTLCLNIELPSIHILIKVGFHAYPNPLKFLEIRIKICESQRFTFEKSGRSLTHFRVSWKFIIHLNISRSDRIGRVYDWLSIFMFDPETSGVATRSISESSDLSDPPPCIQPKQL